MLPSMTPLDRHARLGETTPSYPTSDNAACNTRAIDVERMSRKNHPEIANDIVRMRFPDRFRFRPADDDDHADPR